MANCFHIAYDYTVQDCGPGPLLAQLFQLCALSASVNSV